MFGYSEKIGFKKVQYFINYSLFGKTIEDQNLLVFSKSLRMQKLVGFSKGCSKFQKIIHI